MTLATVPTVAESRMTWRRVAGVAGLLVVMGASLAVASPASAHSQLVSTTPADGAKLTTAPQSVVLTFNEALIPEVDSVSINDADGNVVASQRVQPDGPTITVPWPSGLPAGSYQVAYRVVSGDGHPVVGAIMFTYASGDKAGRPAADAPTAGQVTELPRGSVDAQGESASRGGLVAAAVIGLAVVLTLVAVLVRRRRRALSMTGS